jgi:tetratricopeptide (TPR) repeat protein
MQYAKLLAALGYFSEAETEYTTLLDQNPGQLEAWYQLAAVYVVQKRKREAKKTLQNLIRQSQQAVVLKKKEKTFVQNARLFIDGDLLLDKLTPQDLVSGS